MSLGCPCFNKQVSNTIIFGNKRSVSVSSYVKDARECHFDPKSVLESTTISFPRSPLPPSGISPRRIRESNRDNTSQKWKVGALTARPLVPYTNVYFFVFAVLINLHFTSQVLTNLILFVLCLKTMVWRHVTKFLHTMITESPVLYPPRHILTN